MTILKSLPLNHYRIFGLTIASAVQLPALTGEIDTTTSPDVVIDYDDVPPALVNPQVAGACYQAAPGELLLQVDDVARFHVREGRRITISPEACAGEDDILPYLMGSAMGALLQQRRLLVLHGSAIEVEGASVVFCGPSGIGKSTLAAGFHQRGYRFLADDLCAVAPHDGRPVVIPGFPRLKLWADALERLDTATDDLQSVRWGADRQKFFLPADNRCEVSLPVRAVFILGADDTDRLELTRLSGSGKINPLMANSYRMLFLDGLGGKKEHFMLCAAVAARAEIFRVARPKRGFLLEDLMDLLTERFAP